MLQNLKDYKILRGYDVVSYFDGKPMLGNPSINTLHKGAVYQFITEQHKKLFLENPEKYRPAYGGFCAIAMTEGSTVDAHPEAYIVQNGRLFVFYAVKALGKLWQDTRIQWVPKPFEHAKIGDTVYEKLSNS